MEKVVSDLHKINLAVSLGVVCAIGVFLLGLAAWIFDWGTEIVILVSNLYIGFEPTFLGSIVGALWGFLDGFIGGFLIAWFYNIFLRKKTFRDV